jgi:hypothetical protein
MPLTPLRNGRSLSSLTVVAALLALAPPAHADEKEACVAASDQAQTLRDDGKFRATRAALLVCSRDVCPPIVRRDCDKWIAELDGAQPTLVLGARDPKGNDVPGTHVRLDGVPFMEHLDGKPVAVDPGEHVFRYEAPGATAVEQRVVVRVGEKNRMLTAILMTQQISAPPPVQISVAPSPPPAVPDAPAPDRATPDGHVPAGAWILGGVAVVSAASFAYFGVTGQSDASNLRATCAPKCQQSDVDAVRTKLLVADVSLGVGIVSLATAAWIFFHRDTGSPSPPTAQADLQARPGGFVATFGARF